MQDLINRLGWAVAGVLALAVVALAAGVVRGGPLDPTGAPAPTLSQVEPRMPIPPVGWNGTFPIVINQRGSYYLTRDLLGVSGQNGISISSSDVSLDLNGFALRGVPGSANGIETTGASRTSVVIRNGTVVAWGADGINTVGDGQITIVDVIVGQNGSDGIRIGGTTRVERCFVRGNGAVGIYVESNANEVLDCLISGSNAQGLRVDGMENRIAGNHVIFNGSGCCTGIWLVGAANILDGNTAQQNGNYGIWMAGANNTIVRNIAGANTNGNYNIVGCAGCEIGPIGAAVGATNPWANLEE